MNKINKNSGWYEAADSLLGYAKKHHDAAQKQNFVKEFGNTKKVSIIPHKEIDEIVKLNFDIPEKDKEEFNEITGRFYDSHKNDIDDISIAEEDGKTVVTIPKLYAFEYTQFLLQENENFGADVNDLCELVDFDTGSWNMK